MQTGAAGIGDINGDGIPDLGVGNVLASVGGFNGAGMVDVVAGGTWETLFSYNGTFNFEGLGAVDTAGDFDRDGVPDFVIAAPGSGGAIPPNPFGAWIHSGRDGRLLLRFTACQAAFGFGDVNGDGYSDVAFFDSGPGGMGPTTWTVVGGPDGRVLFRVLPTPPYLASAQISRTGDVDGDGADDYAKTDFLASHRTVLFLSGRDRSLLMRIVGGPNDINIGIVEPAGDTNGDDFPDLLLNNFHPDLATNAVRLYSGAPDGVNSFGLGCAFPSGVVPRIGFSREPKLGETVRMNLSRVPHDASALLLLGTSNQSWVGLPLPIDLGALGLPGCPLLVAPDVVVPLHTGGPDAGRAFISWPLAIPEVQGLQGASFFAQFLVLDDGSGGRGAVTRGLRITIQ